MFVYVVVRVGTSLISIFEVKNPDWGQKSGYRVSRRPEQNQVRYQVASLRQRRECWVSCPCSYHQSSTTFFSFRADYHPSSRPG